MERNKFQQWMYENRTGVITGFVFGAIVAPALAVLGLGWSFFEALRPVLIGPMDVLGMLIPNVSHAGTVYVPVYKWILTLGFNGVCYAFLGGSIQYILKKCSNR